MPELHFARYRNERRFTHYLFRFPAKFHPPALRCLIDRYSKPGDVLLDPFCGSGSLLVEALVSGRSAVGIDIDPVAAFISRVKCRPLVPSVLARNFDQLRKILKPIRRSAGEYDRLIHDDLDSKAIKRFRETLSIPPIPNIEHWFRVYVILDLARLKQAVCHMPTAPGFRDFFLACFASIIRNASNADPVPVSGLEVTSHMIKLDKQGRRIDPFELFERKVEREIVGMRELSLDATNVSIYVRRGDATLVTRSLPSHKFDVVITSPPYNTAVDYYRRHTLEMYWLGFVKSHEERLRLAPRYLGREQVRKTNARLRCTFDSDYIRQLISHARGISAARERALTHYCVSIQRALGHIAGKLKSNGRAVFVIGNSKWNGRRVRATKLLRELAAVNFDVVESLSYSSRNRYMSYNRHNGANVDREYVLVLKKKH